MVIANLFKHIKPNRGSVTIVALVVMIVLGALGATLIKQSISGNKVSASYSDGIAAQYLAEAGIQHAKAEIEKQKYFSVIDVANLRNKTLTGSTGTYNVTISYANGFYTITSTGTVNGAQRRVIKQLERDIYKFTVYGGQNNGQNLFSFVLNRGVSVYPAANVVGHVGCNTNIDYGAYVVTGAVFGAISIKGDVETPGNIVTWPGFSSVNVTGTSRQTTEGKARTIPTVAFPSDFNKTSNIQLTSGTSHTLTANKTYYTSGDLTLYHSIFGSDYIKGNGTIYVNGDLTLKGGLMGISGAYVDDNVTFVVRGDVTLEPGSAMKGEVLIMATGDIWIGTGINYPALNPTTFPAEINKGILLANGNIFINNLGSTLYGSAISKKTVTLYGDSDIQYDATFINEMKPTILQYTN